MDDKARVLDVLDGFRPEAVLVLGSGLGDVAGRVTNARVQPQSALPGVPAAAVSGHGGELITGTLGGRRVLVLSGRLHLYEGLSLPVVTRALRLVLGTGPRLVVLTNAAGAIQRDFRPGELMLIADHLNLSGGSPLEGAHDPDDGPRFPDMSTVWSVTARRAFRSVAEERGVSLREGVYAMLRGPQYETPAEVRMLRLLGADAVGMSTVPEAIVAAARGLPVLGISMLSNLAAGISKVPLRHEEVLAEGRKAAHVLGELLEAGLARAVDATGGQA